MQDKSIRITVKDNPVRVHRVKLHFVPDQPLVVPMPPDLREMDVEVIVLITDPKPPDSSMRTLKKLVRQ